MFVCIDGDWWCIGIESDHASKVGHLSFMRLSGHLSFHCNHWGRVLCWYLFSIYLEELCIAGLSWFYLAIINIQQEKHKLVPECQGIEGTGRLGQSRVRCGKIGCEPPYVCWWCVFGPSISFNIWIFVVIVNVSVTLWFRRLQCLVKRMFCLVLSICVKQGVCVFILWTSCLFTNK